MKQFVLFLIRLIPWLSADYRRRIKPKRKCPACGAVKKHLMKFDPAQKLVAFTCVCCSAQWGYDPVVNVAKWHKAEREG
jgi:hypothetical protein